MIRILRLIQTKKLNRNVDIIVHFLTLNSDCNLTTNIKCDLFRYGAVDAHAVYLFKSISICSPALASVLPPASHPLSEQLRSIASVTVAVVNLEYEG